MKKVCVLLNGPICNDSRVIKEIRTMSTVAEVDLFYLEGTDEDKLLFNNRVRLLPIKRSFNFRTKIIQNTFFYREFLFYVDEVLKQKVKYDYIWANDFPDLMPAVRIKEKIGAKLIYDSHEIFIETLNQCFPSKAVFYKRILYKMCLFIMKKAGRRAEKRMLIKVDRFVTTCESYKSFFASTYKINDIRIVMNCPHYAQVIVPHNLRKEFDIPQNSFIVVFQGKLIPARALHEIIDSMNYVSKDIYMILIGDGMLETKLKKQVRDCNLSRRVFFTGRVPSSEMVNYAAGADLGINLQPNVNLSKYFGSTNKFFEYMHAGLPMIVSHTPENKYIMTKYNMGLFVNDCYNSKEIADAISKMANMDLLDYKENCRKAAKEYNWENQEKIILDLVSY